ncbi:MAG: hypothetical protein D6696_18565 [Acidobacteria bacterium]|nr:MAG: hypothetical protein D6696_18565 [Acidobacteriota bacterium]
MIAGINRLVEHGEKTYTIQAEDLGREAAAFDLRLYEAGALLWSKRVDYRDLLAGGASEEEQEAALHRRMDQAIHTLAAAISRDKLKLD